VESGNLDRSENENKAVVGGTSEKIGVAGWQLSSEKHDTL
jgi:hypothetical protein